MTQNISYKKSYLKLCMFKKTFDIDNQSEKFSMFQDTC